MDNISFKPLVFIKSIMKMEYYSELQLENVPIEELARLMQQYELEQSVWPVSNLDYFINSINQLKGDVGANIHMISFKENYIGYAVVEYRKNEINDLSYGNVEFYVEPNYRVQGYGLKLLYEVLVNLPKQIKTLGFSIRDSSGFNEYLIKNKGIQPRFLNHINLIETTNIDRDELKEELDQLLKKVETLDYQLVQLNDQNYPLDDQSYADLMKATWNANTGQDTDIEPEDFPVSRVQGRFEFVKNQNGIIHTSAIKNKEGKWIGLSEIFVYETNPELGKQSLTGVLPSYRGNRLGYVLKIQNILHVAENTDVTHVITTNASKNEPIMKISRKLGFRPAVVMNRYEITTQELKKILAIE